VQFTLPVLSHYSYLLVSGPEAVLMDPDRDINGYLDYAKKHGLTRGQSGRWQRGVD
jgi:hypothetical protein